MPPRKRQDVEPEPVLNTESPPEEAVVEAPAPASAEPPALKPAPQEMAEKAPAKTDETLRLVGAGSYTDLRYGLGLVRKGQTFTVDAGKAASLMRSGMFERA